jgi:hypothetical protein
MPENICSLRRKNCILKYFRIISFFKGQYVYIINRFSINFGFMIILQILTEFVQNVRVLMKDSVY